MYDSVDGKTAGILKNTDVTTSYSIYAHKDSVTISSGGPLQYVKAPEFREPVILHNPPYPENPEKLFDEVGEVAKQNVIQIMRQNQASHGNEWLAKSIDYHKRHAYEHAEKAYIGVSKDDDIGSCLTRCAFIKYLKG